MRALRHSVTVLQTNYKGGIVNHILGVAEKWAVDRSAFRCILLVTKKYPFVFFLWGGGAFLPCILILPKFLFTNECTSYCLRNNMKSYIKIAPICIGAVTPSSGSSLSILAKVTLY